MMHRFRPPAILDILSCLIIALYWWPVKEMTPPMALVLEDKDGTLLGARIAADGQWRFPLTDSIPSQLGIAILQFEDEYFHWHPGVNPVSLLKAVIANIRHGKWKRGASTIPMQLARIRLNNPNRTIGNKLIEAWMAIRMTFRHSKEEVLHMFLQTAPFGGNVVGVEAASWRYYGKAATLLTWAESALLAVLPNHPAMIHPGRNRDKLLHKRNRLLYKLHQNHFLDEPEYQMAIAEPIPEKPLPLPNYVPELLDGYHNAGSKGRITTTIQTQLQLLVRDKMAYHAQILHGNGIQNMAVLIVDNPTGKVMVYAGNTPKHSDITPGRGHQVDIIRALRSPGSTLKPFLYAWSMEDGLIWPNMLLSDIPSQYGSYRPENFNRQFHGVVPASQAIASSLNIPMVRLLHSYGIERFLKRLHQQGFHSLNKPPSYYGLSLILGGGEVSLWELVQAYTQMAQTLSTYLDFDSRYPRRFNQLHTHSTSNEGEDFDDRTLQSNPGLISAGAVWAMLEAMTLPDRPDEYAYWDQFSSSRKIAWKTGTSFGFKDAWAIGLTPEWTIGVWVGNATGAPRPDLTGIKAAAPLLFDLCDLMPPSSWFGTPYDDLSFRSVCSISGHPNNSACPVDSAWVPVKNHIPAKCPFHIEVLLDPETRFQVNSDCFDPALSVKQSWFVLPPAEAWYYSRSHIDYLPLPPLHPACTPATDGGNLQLIFPNVNARLVTAVGLDGNPQPFVFMAAHSDPRAEIFWHIDDHFMGSTHQPHSLSIPLKPGIHWLIITDHTGNSITRKITVAEK